MGRTAQPPGPGEPGAQPNGSGSLSADQRGADATGVQLYQDKKKKSKEQMEMQGLQGWTGLISAVSGLMHRFTQGGRGSGSGGFGGSSVPGLSSGSFGSFNVNSQPLAAQVKSAPAAGTTSGPGSTAGKGPSSGASGAAPPGFSFVSQGSATAAASSPQHAARALFSPAGAQSGPAAGGLSAPGTFQRGFSVRETMLSQSSPSFHVDRWILANPDGAVHLPAGGGELAPAPGGPVVPPGFARPSVEGITAGFSATGTAGQDGANAFTLLAFSPNPRDDIRLESGPTDDESPTAVAPEPPAMALLIAGLLPLGLLARRRKKLAPVKG